MPTPSPVLEALAHRYTQTQAGRTGQATRDLLVPLETLLAAAGCPEGERRALAEQQLAEAERAGLLRLDPVHPRDQTHIHQVRFSSAAEEALFARLGRPSPTRLRQQLADQFTRAAETTVPAPWAGKWRNWCQRMAAAAAVGQPITPFDRQPGPANAQLLALLPRLLAWEGESLVRFASCALCGDSKQLESLAAPDREGPCAGQLRGKLGRLLEAITDGALRTLEDLAILPNPRFALLHGPLRLELDGHWLDCGLLHGPCRLAGQDLERSEQLVTTARRCLTVENETSFHELAKLRSGELLIQTSYPGSGTLALLRRLPDALEFWHFGDSDDAGFDILRVLREKSGRPFQPLHMQPGRVPAEQEALGRPTLQTWPFYSEV